MSSLQHPRRSLLALAALGLALPVFAETTTVVDERFADGNRSGQSRALPLPSLAWRLGPSAVSNSVAGGFWGVTPSSSAILVGQFHSVTLAVGDTLTVSFSYRHSVAPTVTSFRIGLLDSGGTRLTADAADVAPAAFASYAGYMVFNGLGTATGNGGYNVRENTTASANIFGMAENTLLPGTTDKGPGLTAAGTLYTGSITLSYETLTAMRVATSFSGGVVNTGTDATPVTTFDTLALFITSGSGKFELGDVVVTTTGTVTVPPPPAPRVLEIDRRGGASYTSIAAAVATGLNPGDTLRLAPGSGPYREVVYLPASGTAAAPIVFDASGETVTGANILGGFQTADGVTTCDLTSYWASGNPQGFSKVNGRWAAISVPAASAQPLPFVLTYNGERIVQSATVRTTPPAGSPAGTLGKLGQLTRYATISDDGNTLTLLPGVSADGWEISARDFAIRIFDTSHQTYRNIKATGSLNDGFNLHGVGENLRFENIEGFNNLDEGFSAHDTIACVIKGGVFYRNDNGLVNVNNSGLVADDVLCHDNLGYGVAFMNAAIADFGHLRTARNGVRDLAVHNQSTVTLAHATLSGGGWTRKPLLSAVESGGLNPYLGLDVATGAGARLLGQAPVVAATTAPITLDLDSAGANLEVVFFAPLGEQSQLQISTDLVTWEAAGPIRTDDILHRWSEPVAARRFYRVVRW